MKQFSAFFGLVHAGWVMAREGVFTGFDVETMPTPAQVPVRLANLLARKRTSRDRADRLSSALARLGPSYIKLGQFFATRPDLVGRDIARDLEALQDKMPPFSERDARAEVEKVTGEAIGTTFHAFGPAIAAASIAQVHKAELRDPDTGAIRHVAVKVLRPDVEKRFNRDLEGFYLFARLVEALHRPSRRLRPVAVVDTLAQSVRFEMDLRMEAAALSEMAQNTEADPGFTLPDVVWPLSSKRVLTTEWVEGLKLNRIADVMEAGHDPEKLAATLIQSFLRHALRDGFFHADMHPGNLFIREDGMVVAIDMGIAGRLSRPDRRVLAEILYGFITRNYRRIAEVHFEAGYVPHTQDVDAFAQALRAIGEPIHGRDASEISMGHLLTQLFEVTELFDMHTQPQLILLQKTMVVVEGVARTFDPHLDMWKVAEPVVSEWIMANLGPSGRLREAAVSLGAISRLMADAPDLLARSERVLKALDDNATTPQQQKRDNRSLRLPLWIGALSLAAMALSMLT